MRRVGEIGRYNDDNCIGLLNENFDAFPPILEGVDFGSIDEYAEVRALYALEQSIDESAVPSRIGDEGRYGLGDAISSHETPRPHFEHGSAGKRNAVPIKHYISSLWYSGGRGRANTKFDRARRATLRPGSSSSS